MNHLFCLVAALLWSSTAFSAQNLNCEVNEAATASGKSTNTSSAPVSNNYTRLEMVSASNSKIRMAGAYNQFTSVLSVEIFDETTHTLSESSVDLSQGETSAKVNYTKYKDVNGATLVEGFRLACQLN